MLWENRVHNLIAITWGRQTEVENQSNITLVIPRNSFWTYLNREQIAANGETQKFHGWASMEQGVEGVLIEFMETQEEELGAKGRTIFEGCLHTLLIEFSEIKRGDEWN